MDKRLKLTVDDILNKQFNVDFKGYSCIEVDEFLDLVISDFQEYETMMTELGDRLQEYERQITALKTKIMELEGKQDVAAEKNTASDNVDILRRLTRLENAVFSKD